jgi:ribosomal protein S27E
MDLEDDKDTPIDEQDFIAGVKVIDFGDIRVARGLTRRPFSTCKHRHMVYDPKERRIWCKDCETNVEAFDAFVSLVENFHSAWKEVYKLRDEVEQAKKHNLHLIAAKNIEKAWRGRSMAVSCSHCGGGLLPEDFSPLGIVCSAEIERKRREKLKEPKK